ncbi:hypothetical protein OJF2_26860 [Aquisphaera giovannonii]|uniref:DUF2961 domain-containing protein n=1 Tax=Aquisphaera giovannonii TaxID=406548 RepID=A0A5B9W1S9_9BACT|nr:DUF2961 domain-containing protein [Aquisphaera giovannonii]QEH34151.1 hypothetical protein OJF2_26860 [Aquisphaera giovannonii]
MMTRKRLVRGLLLGPLILAGAIQSASAEPPAPADEARAPAPPMRLFGGMGKEVKISPGEEKVLFERAGAGTLTHMWFGGDWPAWGDTRIRIYVDGEERPGIDMALFLGHGIGWGNDAAPWGTNRVGKTGRPSGVYNTYRIPFGKGVKVTATMAPSVRDPQVFWWIVRGLTDYPVRLGGITLPPSARLKLHRLDKVRAEPLKDVTIADTPARGLLYAVTFEAISDNFNYLEACLRAYPNGAKEPVWMSSGTEDYFLGTYYFNAGLYHNPVAGLTHCDPDRPGSSYRFSAYRFHEDDPVPFQEGLRLVWRNGEELDGHRYGDPKPTTLTSYVWTYEW